MKSIEEIKDEYAQESGFNDFYDYIKNSTIGEIDHHCSHVAMVFANQYKSDVSNAISDDEIEKEADKRYTNQTDVGQFRNYAFQDGAEWYRKELKYINNSTKKEENNNWKKQMRELEIGQAFETDAANYGSIRAMRSKLRLDGFDFQFKLGKGTLTVRRIA